MRNIRGLSLNIRPEFNKMESRNEETPDSEKSFHCCGRPEDLNDDPITPLSLKSPKFLKEILVPDHPDYYSYISGVKRQREAVLDLTSRPVLAHRESFPRAMKRTCPLKSPIAAPDHPLLVIKTGFDVSPSESSNIDNQDDKAIETKSTLKDQLEKNLDEPSTSKETKPTYEEFLSKFRPGRASFSRVHKRAYSLDSQKTAVENAWFIIKPENVPSMGESSEVINRMRRTAVEANSSKSKPTRRASLKFFRDSSISLNLLQPTSPKLFPLKEEATMPKKRFSLMKNRWTSFHNLYKLDEGEDDLSEKFKPVC